MGQFGPIPKHSSERRRRNKESQPETVSHLPVDAPRGAPALGFPAHELVEDWYASLAESAQSQFYQASDWQYARVAAFELNRMVNSGRPSAQMLAALDAMFANLLTTEGARRRVRMEIEQNPRGEKEAPVTALERYRQKRQGTA